MKTSALSAGLVLAAILFAAGIGHSLRHDPTVATAEAKPPEGQLSISERVSAAKWVMNDLEQDIGITPTRVAMADKPKAEQPQPLEQQMARFDAAMAKTKPVRLATFFEWECPDEAEEHMLHEFSIVTDAQHIDAVVDRIVFSPEDLKKPPVELFGPTEEYFDEDGDGQPDNAQRLLKYVWTAPPGYYRVEVITSDDVRGFTRNRQNVEFTGSIPPVPPPTPGGFGIAAKVPAWLATVPKEARGNQPAIKEAVLDLANKASQFSKVEEMSAAFGAVLGAVIEDKAAWASFGKAWNAEALSLVSSGKIETPAQYAQALRELGDAL